MKIGELAQASGISIDTVRFYERTGVLPPAPRRASGYRDYSETDVRRVLFVRRAKRLGFSLEEIRGLLALSENRSRDMAGFSDRARAKLDDITQRIAELERVRQALRSLIDECPGHGALEACPILAALTSRDGDTGIASVS